MFTINIYLKFALIIVGLVGGTILSLTMGFWYGFPLILLGIIMLASYILLGTVQSAAQMVERMEFEEADQRLDLTWKPDWLYVTNRAFYYIMKGNIAAQRKDNKAAELYFTKALELDLPSDNEKAMVLTQLANIYATRNNWTASRNYINQAKKLHVTNGQIKEQLDQFDKALKNNMGQSKAARSMGKGGMRMMQRGAGKSKRRRPKSR